jgi:hypothetical protein
LRDAGIGTFWTALWQLFNSKEFAYRKRKWIGFGVSVSMFFVAIILYSASSSSIILMDVFGGAFLSQGFGPIVTLLFLLEPEEKETLAMPYVNNFVKWASDELAKNNDPPNSPSSPPLSPQKDPSNSPPSPSLPPQKQEPKVMQKVNPTLTDQTSDLKVQNPADTSQTPKSIIPASPRKTKATYDSKFVLLVPDTPAMCVDMNERMKTYKRLAKITERQVDGFRKFSISLRRIDHVIYHFDLPSMLNDATPRKVQLFQDTLNAYVREKQAKGELTNVVLQRISRFTLAEIDKAVQLSQQEEVVASNACC